MNILPAEAFDMRGGADVSPLMRFLTFLGFCAGFGGIFGASYLMISDYLVRVPVAPPNLSARYGGDASLLLKWPGIAVFLQNIFIFIA